MRTNCFLNTDSRMESQSFIFMKGVMMTKYKPSELAEMFGLHPNTIRMYEKIGFLSKAEREANGYRSFTKVQLYQLKICRCIFNQPFTNRKIRAAGNLIIKAAANKDLKACSIYSGQYISIIHKEIENAELTVQLLKDWAEAEDIGGEESSGLYSRKEAAHILGTTIEAVRNWERNGLIYSEKTGDLRERLFDEKDIKRLRVIYMLRQAGYSMTAIHSSLSMYDAGFKDRIVTSLNKPELELLSVGDNWLEALTSLERDASQIPEYITKLREIIN